MEGRALSDLKLCGCAHPSETGPEEHGLVRTTGTDLVYKTGKTPVGVFPVRKTQTYYVERRESVKRNISIVSKRMT